MEYSNLTDIIVQNFKSIKKAHIKVSENGITTFKGGNGVGKTTILEALQVALTDYKPSRQHSFIKHHENFFRVHLKFDDGVEIIKDKYLNGGSLYEMYKDGKCLYTNKTGNKITAIKGVPDIIRDYVGIPTFEKRIINFQNGNQELLLVDTKPGENYRMLGKASDDGSLPKSLEMLTANKKEVNGKIQKAEADIYHQERLKAEIPNISKTLIEAIKEKDKYVDNLDKEYTEINSILSLIEDIKNSKELLQAPLKKVENISEINSITEIINLCHIVETPLFPNINKVRGYEELDNISTILNLIEQVKSSNIVPVPNKVNTDELSDIVKIIDLLNENKKIQNVCKKLEAEKQSILKEQQIIDIDLTNDGYKTTKCPHCGKYHIVDLMGS